MKKEHFTKPFFLVMLLIGMGCHALNNSGMAVDEAFKIRVNNQISIPIAWIQIILALITYGILLYMLRRGINQALEVNDINQAILLARRGGGAAPTLVGLAGTCAGGAFVVEDRPVIVGREPKECNLVLGGDAVSRKHGALRKEGSQLIYQDLGSSNGSFVNGKKMTPYTDYSLQPGDVLEIGSSGERFEVK